MSYTTSQKDAQSANREPAKQATVDSIKPIISLTNRNTSSSHASHDSSNATPSIAAASEYNTIRTRKTYIPNTSYRGNFEVPPKDTKPTFYSTAGGYFYKKPNGNREATNENNDPHLNRVSKRR